MIIKVMKNNYYQTSSRLDMIIKVVKNNYYQASSGLDMIIKVNLKNDRSLSESETRHDN